MAMIRTKPLVDALGRGADDFVALSAALRTLDEVLTIAVDAQAHLLGPASMLDPWRGMHVEQADVQRLLKNSAPFCFVENAQASVTDALAAALCAWRPAELVAEKLGLLNVELAALLIVLAPDLDLRYERIYGYLQDDITRKRPTLDLIANLLARDAAERLALCARFHGNAPLSRFDLLVASGSDTAPLARTWRVDELWRKWFAGDDDIGAQVGNAVRLVTPPPVKMSELHLDPRTASLVRAAVGKAVGRIAPVRLLIQGPHGGGKFTLAQAAAHELKQRLLVIDLRDCTHVDELRTLLRRAQCAAVLFGAVLYLHGIVRLEQREPQLMRALVEALGTSACSFVLVSATQLSLVQSVALPVLRIELAYPSAALRGEIWRQALTSRDLQVDPASELRIAAQFPLSMTQIQQAVAEAHAVATTLDDHVVSYEDLAIAVGMQCGSELARIAQRITPRAAFTALVLPEDVQTQLREICARMATRETVRREWGDGSVHARTTGVMALFAGPSGTGKTLAAEALARELGLELYRIDLAGTVSKYIGETEKNLERVFAAAKHANAVLFFDEADALFGKRSEAKDAHDRYANIETAYLLQKMEQFDGLAILATNLKQNLDEAFARRLTFTVTFPFPEEAERRRLWEVLWPPHAPRAQDVDLAWFAREFRLSGGNIRNTVMAAAHLAAADDKIVTRAHLMHATRREYQKLGKNLADPLPIIEGHYA